MQPNIPVPTDNLYKFQALFGLVIIISAIAGLYLTYATTNAELVTIADRFYELEKEQLAAQQETVAVGAVAVSDSRSANAAKGVKAVLEKRIEVAVSNRRTYVAVLFLGMFLGGVLAYFGFTKWAKIQPMHDRLLELQVQKAEKELNQP
ncbi:hypothetical protein IB227_02080 [Stenotrophomonas sp. STM01]|uniref:hypothetical protein n=1 Tax=Stenotrophomonas sp. STM01 TaxID=2769278 RepID=UPI00177B66A4|nr:hypothetical protein [Stenotrophomonas sp. STM01]MBD9534637.1 hypothetical protein [Stenotrophomonas sp. STM01]